MNPSKVNPKVAAIADNLISFAFLSVRYK